MGIVKSRSCCLVLLFSFYLQSLTDVAREEAERRRRLDEQGVQTKTIDGNAVGQVLRGNVSTSTESGMTPKAKPALPVTAKSQASLPGYRTSLQKLDRAIQQTEARLASKQASMRSGKWANPSSGMASSQNQAKDAQGRLQAEIEELQLKLKQLREERFEIYEAGKKAGFMPGELDGKGIIP